MFAPQQYIKLAKINSEKCLKEKKIVLCFRHGLDWSQLASATYKLSNVSAPLLSVENAALPFQPSPAKRDQFRSLPPSNFSLTVEEGSKMWRIKKSLFGFGWKPSCRTLLIRQHLPRGTEKFSVTVKAKCVCSSNFAKEKTGLESSTNARFKPTTRYFQAVRL